MAERVIETKVILTGEDECVAGLERITAALNALSAALKEAKKEFNAFGNKAPNSQDDL